MAINSNGFEFVDFTSLLEVAPRQNTLITSLNLFDAFYHQSTTALVTRIDETRADIAARQRGGERNFIGREGVIRKSFLIPFFPLDKGFTAQDVQNFSQYGEPNAPMAAQERVMRTMDRIQRSHAELRERAMVTAIMGSSYAPEDPNSQYNYYTEWNQTQQTVTVDFTSATVDPATAMETQIRKSIIANAGNGAQSYRIYALCSPEYFQALIDNAFVRTAYQYFAANENILRQRVSGDLNNRSFTYGGVTFLEDISGYIPANEAFFFPGGIDGMFEVHYAPADTLNDANTLAKEAYVFYVENHRRAHVETESSLLCVNTRPELVIRSVADVA